MDFFGTRTSGDTSGYSKSANTSSSYSGNSSDYVVESSYLDRIEQVIQWSLNNDLITILDFHGATLNNLDMCVKQNLTNRIRKTLVDIVFRDNPSLNRSRSGQTQGR